MLTTTEERYVSHVHHFLAVSARYLGLAENADALPAREFNDLDRLAQGQREPRDCRSQAA